MSKRISHPLFTLPFILFATSGVAGTPLISSPDCSSVFAKELDPGIFDPPLSYEEEAAVDPVHAISVSRVRRNSAAVRQMAKAGEWNQVARLLVESGIPAEPAKFQLAGEAISGVALNLETPSDDLLIRTLKRLRTHWDGIKPGSFP